MTGIEKAIREMIRLGEMHGRGEAEVELTIEIFQKIESLEYEDVSSDKENLQKDVRRIGEDLKVGIRDCKEEFELEYC